MKFSVLSLLFMNNLKKRLTSLTKLVSFSRQRFALVITRQNLNPSPPFFVTTSHVRHLPIRRKKSSPRSERCRTLSFATSFEASMSLVGTPMEADELLGHLLGLIAHSGKNFPIVQLPEMRLASIEGFPVAVFFRLKGDNDAVIERLLVMNASLLKAA
jgi:hypothetical protein